MCVGGGGGGGLEYFCNNYVKFPWNTHYCLKDMMYKDI